MALFGFLGYFAVKGYLSCLLIGLGLYAADFGMMFFVYYGTIIKEAYSWTNYAFTLVTHILVFVTLIIALVAYYQVFDIEKRFNKNKKDKIIEQKEETEVIARGD